MTTDIRLIESDGRFWVNVSMGDCALEPRGPFGDVGTAEAAAARLAAICRGVLHGAVHIVPTPAAARKRSRA